MSHLALDPKHYHWENWLKVFPNPIAQAHWQRSCEEGGSSLHKVIWALECTPILGNIVELFETIVVCSARAIARRCAKPKSEDKPKPAPLSPPDSPGSPKSQPNSEFPPLSPSSSIPPSSPSSSPPPSPHHEEEQELLPPPALENRTICVVKAEPVGAADPAPVAAPGAPDPVQRAEAKPQLSAEELQRAKTKFRAAVMACVVAKRFENSKKMMNAVAKATVVPPMEMPPAILLSMQLYTSACNLLRMGVLTVDALVNMENSHTVRAIDERLTAMAPGLRQLHQTMFDQALDHFIVFRAPLSPLRLMQYMGLGEGVGATQIEFNREMHRMMASHCQRAPQAQAALAVPQDANVSQSLDAMLERANTLLDGAGKVYNTQWSIQKRAADAQRSVAAAISRPGLSEAAASAQATACVDAMCQTMGETLRGLSQSNEQGAATAQQLEKSLFCHCLVEMSKPVLSAGLGKLFFEINSAVNKKFAEKFIVKAGVEMTADLTMQAFNELALPQMEAMLGAYQQQLFDSCPQLAACAPFLQTMMQAVAGKTSLTDLERMLYQLHMLDYLKHMFVLYDAVMRNGKMDLNVILASKDGYGDPKVAQAVTAICSVLGRGDAALTQQIEANLRNVLAMTALTLEMQAYVQSDKPGLLEALNQDSMMLSESTRQTAKQLVGGVMQGPMEALIAWWKEPSGPEMEALKQSALALLGQAMRLQGLVQEAAPQVAGLQAQAQHPHAAQALSSALTEAATNISYTNRAGMLGIQLARLPADYLIFGDLAGALITTSLNVAKATAVQGAVCGIGRRAVQAGVGAGVQAAQIDDRFATFTKQLCALGDEVAGKVQRGELNRPAQPQLEQPQ